VLAYDDVQGRMIHSRRETRDALVYAGFDAHPMLSSFAGDGLVGALDGQRRGRMQPVCLAGIGALIVELDPTDMTEVAKGCCG
jgi:hypothetical protein